MTIPIAATVIIVIPVIPMIVISVVIVPVVGIPWPPPSGVVTPIPGRAPWYIIDMVDILNNRP
jgi:hypothetical protein